MFLQNVPEQGLMKSSDKDSTGLDQTPPITLTPTNPDKKSIWSFGVSKLSPSRRSVDITNLEKQNTASAKKNQQNYDYSNLSQDFNNSALMQNIDIKLNNHSEIVNNLSGNQILGPPEILSRSQDMAIQVGYMAVLSCRIKNYEGAKITWRKTEPNQMVIQNSSKFNYTTSSSGEARLAINQTASTDSGMYVCAVSNRYGSTQCTIGVTIVSKSSSHDNTQLHGTDINIEVVNPTSVRVSWDFTSATNSYVIEYCRIGTMKWTKNDDKPVRSRYILTGLTPGESYTFRLLCLNTNVASLPSTSVTMPLSETHMWQQQQFNNRYTTLSELGRGRFAVIRLASDSVTGHHVALKQISRKHQDLLTTQEEYKILASVQHPNIVRGLAFFENAPNQGIDTIVMEL